MIKVCGMREADNIREVETLDIDMMGFIFWPKSSRYVSQRPDHLPNRVKRVGVFVDEDPEQVKRLADDYDLDYIQLHGHEPPEYAEALRSAADVRIIKAFRWRDDFSVEAANDYPADYILLDTFKKGMAGGTGETFRWREAAHETRKLKKPLLLAGGISEENAEEAARTLSPFALDVSGSLEENGEKSPEKIAAFMQEIERIRTS